MTELTDRQHEVLTTIRVLTQRKRWAPTLKELMAELDLSSTNAMADHLKALQRKGCVDWEPGKSRTLHITARGYRQLSPAQEEVAA